MIAFVILLFLTWIPRFSNMLAIVYNKFKPPQTVALNLTVKALLVNTTPNSWFWLLTLGNGLCWWFPDRDHELSWLVADWPAVGVAADHLAWGRHDRWRGHFPPTKCFVNVCCHCLQAGSTSWWKSCQWSETSTTVTHVATLKRNPEEMKHYRTVLFQTVTYCQTQRLYF